MKEVLCICLVLSFLWEQMVKAYKYMSGIFLVTHPSKQRASDCSGQPTKMDVSILEEQYGCLKQKQKLQTHVIVFKTGENEASSGESMVNAVVINKKMKKAKTIKESVSTKDVCVECPCSGNTQENSPWRIHLELHRLAQGQQHQNIPFDSVQDKNEQISIENQELSQKSEESCEKFLRSTEQSIGLLNQQEKTSVTRGNDSSSSPLTSVSSPVWTHSQISAPKWTTGSNKLYYYPFPQKKIHKISEAAKRVGLYVSR
ncbi:hypothetical protein JRQ81_018428 [Phrynocephalus forsythii]|uniref:TBC1 domain-containing protein n=1 Tax=Phrynocephalus forsythii TaxID=171643 RepID=A0A9Q0XRX5_9SAUR|nr:hypothetical protein JRQ81_018428 [Phrynocephalus forsythii]